MRFALAHKATSYAMLMAGFTAMAGGGGWLIPYRWVPAMPRWLRSPLAGQVVWKWIGLVFLLASAIGTLLGGVLVDRLGQKPVIWASILGIAPFALMLPYVNLFWTVTFTVLIGLILSSAFSAILVYAQELIPGKVGMVSGLFFGLAFGMGGLGAALLGVLADHTSIEFVYRVIAFLPLIGMVTAFLPKVRRR